MWHLELRNIHCKFVYLRLRLHHQPQFRSLLSKGAYKADEIKRTAAWRDISAESLCPPSVRLSDSKLSCSRNPFSDYFIDWTPSNLSHIVYSLYYYLGHFENPRFIDCLIELNWHFGSVQFNGFVSKTSTRTSSNILAGLRMALRSEVVTCVE